MITLLEKIADLLALLCVRFPCVFVTFQYGVFPMGSFMKIIPSRYGKISLLLTDEGKSCPSRKFLTWQICLLKLYMEIKFSQKFPITAYQNQNYQTISKGIRKGMVSTRLFSHTLAMTKAFY